MRLKHNKTYRERFTGNEWFTGPLSPYGMISALTLALGFGIVFWLVPPYADDLWYGLRNAHYIRGLAPEIDWQGVADTIGEHLAIDNARLPNVIMSVAVLAPKWLVALISTILWFYALCKVFRLSGAVKGSGCLPAALAVFAVSFLLPWFEAFGALAYQLGYIWATAIVLWCMGLYLHKTTADPSDPTSTNTGFNAGNTTGPRTCYLGCLGAGLFLGIWHEGFSATFIAFGATMMLCDRRHYFNIRCVLMLAGCLAGTMLLFAVSPALDRAGGLHEGLSLSKLMITALGQPAFMLLCLAWLGALCFRRLRCRLRKGPNRPGLFFAISLSAGGAANFLIHFVSVNSPRAGWCGQIFSIIALLTLLRVTFPTLFTPCRARILPLKAIAAWLLLAVSFIRLGFSDCYAIKLHNGFPRVITEAAINPCHQSFTDFPTEFDAPPVCAFFPDFTFYTAPANRLFMMHFYDFEKEGFAVVPSALDKIDITSGSPISSDRNIRRKGPYIFVPVENLPEITGQTGEIKADVGFGPITRHAQRILYFRFTSKTDGRDYYWLYPWRSMPFCLIYSPESMTDISFPSGN